MAEKKYRALKPLIVRSEGNRRLEVGEVYDAKAATPDQIAMLIQLEAIEEFTEPAPRKSASGDKAEG